MANESFIRAASLLIGKTAIPTTEFAGLRIKFEIEKTSEKAPNPAKITIYNLTEENRAKLDDKALRVILSVGYRGIDPTAKPVLKGIFQGDLRKVSSKREGPDITTTIEAGDGEVAINETHVDKSYGPFSTAQQVVGGLAAKMGIPLGTVFAGFTQVFTGGTTVSGNAADELDKLVVTAGLEWSIQDGKLNILPKDKPTLEIAVVLTEDTGLIGIPNKSDKGYEFSALLNPDLTPGRAVILTSSLIKGNFRIRRVVHTGDTNTGEWYSKVEAIGL